MVTDFDTMYVTVCDLKLSFSYILRITAELGGTLAVIKLAFQLNGN